MNVKEYEFSVPWGVIGVKAWGNETDPIVLVIHGITDNACSFDRLIPLLPKCFYYACVELPGHGKSSPFPQNMPIITINYIPTYHYIFEHFGKDKYVLMGHSYGAQIGQLVAQLWPEKISKIIMLDTLHLFSIEPDNFADYLRQQMEQFMRLQKKLDKGVEAPLYTYDDAVKRIINGRSGQLSEESAKCLLKRHLIPVGDKFKFSQDPRIKFFINPLQSMDYIEKVFKNNPLQCPCLILMATGAHMERRLSRQKMYELVKKQNCISIVKVEGNHDVHNDNPEIVAPHITKFLLETKSKL